MKGDESHARLDRQCVQRRHLQLGRELSGPTIAIRRFVPVCAVAVGGRICRVSPSVYRRFRPIEFARRPQERCEFHRDEFFRRGDFVARGETHFRRLREWS